MSSGLSEQSPKNPDTGYKPQPALERIAKIDIFDENCQAHQALERIASKWVVLIIYALSQGKKRYSELQRHIQGVSPKMLIQNLRSLERYGLVERKVYPVVPPQVEYSLTPLGQTLVEPMAVLGEWAYRHLDDMKAACDRYDNDVSLHRKPARVLRP